MRHRPHRILENNIVCFQGSGAPKDYEDIADVFEALWCSPEHIEGLWTLLGL